MEGAFTSGAAIREIAVYGPRHPLVNRRSSNSSRSINHGRQTVTTNTSSRPDVLLTVSRVLDRPPARPGNLFIRLPRKDGRMNHRDRFLLKLQLLKFSSGIKYKFIYYFFEREIFEFCVGVYYIVCGRE